MDRPKIEVRGLRYWAGGTEILLRAINRLIDATKTTGIIFLPGAMVGMIIAGADPLVAVRLQIVVLYRESL